MSNDEVYYEYRVVLTRGGLRHLPRRCGGRAYRRIEAANEAQARRFVAEEEADGFKAWIERREISPWRRIR